MITLNLFDENFRHCDYSVAHQESQHVRWVRDRKVWDGITLFTDAYVIDGTASEVQCPVKVGWLHEPQSLHPRNYRESVAVCDEFDFILTYWRPLLAMHGFEFCPYGGVWIPQAEWRMHEKRQLVSMLYGSKMSAPGHRMRHEIAAALGDYSPVDFYGFKGVPTNYGWETKLRVHAPYMFSIVCETAEEDNLFTEILLDCFAVGCVPLFWGAPNIGSFFDGRGIIQFNTAEEAEYLVRCLTPALYREMEPYVRNNLREVAKYRVTEDWMVESGVFEGVM